MRERRLISKVHKSNYFAFKQPPWIQSIIISACARPIFFLPARRVKNMKIIARNGVLVSEFSVCIRLWCEYARTYIMSSRYLLSVFGRMLAKVTLHAPESALALSPHTYIYIYSTPMYIVMDKRTSLALESRKNTAFASALRNHKWCGQLQHSIIFLFACSATRCAVSWMPLVRQRQIWRCPWVSTMPKHTLCSILVYAWMKHPVKNLELRTVENVTNFVLFYEFFICNLHKTAFLCSRWWL